MFGREMRSKLPELRRETVHVPREEVRDRDWSNKLKGKAYADARRGAMPKSIRVGDAVLLKAEKSNKFSTNFRSSPFKVVEKTGSDITVRNETGVELKRNTAFVKRYNDPGGGVRDVLPASELSGRSLVESSSPIQAVPESVSGSSAQAVPESVSGNEIVQAEGHVSSSTDQRSIWKSSRVVRKPVRFQDYVLN